MAASDLVPTWTVFTASFSPPNNCGSKKTPLAPENALALNPNHAGLLNNHGILLKDYNRKDEAIETLKNEKIPLTPKKYELFIRIYKYLITLNI